MGLAIYFNRAYSISAVKQMAVGFGDLLISRRTYRPIIGGFFTSALCRSASFMGGLRWEVPTGTLVPRNPVRQLPLYARPPHLAMGSGLINSFLGGHDMANSPISVRPEQSLPLFPMAARAARKAARQWFAGIPTQSLAEWRDSCRQDHCHGLPNFDARGAAFDDAFAREIGNLIIGGGRANA